MSSSIKTFEQVTCKTIDTSENSTFPDWTSEPFMLEKEYSVPERFYIELYEGVTYVITRWNSNHIIRFTRIKPEENCFEVIEEYGSPLKVGEVYILRRPKY